MGRFNERSERRAFLRGMGACLTGIGLAGCFGPGGGDGGEGDGGSEGSDGDEGGTEDGEGDGGGDEKEQHVRRLASDRRDAIRDEGTTR